MQTSTPPARRLRAVQAPVSALAVVLLAFNLLLPISPSNAFQILCLGTSGGGIAVAVDGDGLPKDGDRSLPHCPLCTAPGKDAAIAPGSAAPPLAIVFSTVPVAYAPLPVEPSVQRSPFAHGARAPPFV